MAPAKISRRTRSLPSQRRPGVQLVVEVLEPRDLPAGTWTPLANMAPSPAGPYGDYLGTMLLLTDGTVMVQGGDVVNTWYKLTPNATGSYINGTWSQIASMSTPRSGYGSAVLPSGNVFVIGGEYSGASGALNFTNAAEIYNPLTNSWAPTATFPQSQFGDDPVEVLNNGLVLAGYLSGPQTYLYNPTTDSWSNGGTKLRNDQTDEETWVKLPDGSILSYDIFNSLSTGTGSAQRYLPSTNTWVDAGTVPVPLSAASVPRGGTFYELGPGFLLQDGRVIQIGGISNTALYTPSTNTWAAGPTIPNGEGADDAPGAVLPNGHVIFAADTPYGNAPTQLFDFDPVVNTITPMTLPAALTSELQTSPAFNDTMLMLPTGELLFGDTTDQLWVYNDNTTASAAFQPTISSVVPNGNATYTITGTQLNGVSEGANFGDDLQMATNYPIVRLTSTSGAVYTARTFNWTSLVASGSTPVSTQFTLPAGFPIGSYTLTVSANGISSAPVNFTQSLAIVSSTPANGAIVSSPPTSFSVTFDEPVMPSTVQASKLQVNGIPATSVALSSGNTVATFTFNTSPVTAEGPLTIAIAANAITGMDGTQNPAFSSSIYYDTLVLAVTSTTPAIGSVINPPGPGATLTFAVTFNRAIDPSTVSTANLSVSQGTVTAANVQPGNMTVDYIISGLTTGVVSVAIPTGQVLDSVDNPYFTPFSGTFTISLPAAISPYVVSIDRTTPIGPSTSATSVTWTITFNKPVTGVVAADFQLATATGTVAATSTQLATVSLSVYTVTVSGITGSGPLGLNLVDNNTIRDLSGNALVQANGPATFQTPATFAAGSNPVSVVLADVNGDGIPDLIVANQTQAGSVSVLLGNGNGTFQSPRTFATGSYPFQVVAADVNGDGNVDLITANYTSNSVSVLLGNGNGTFKPQTTYATGIYPASVAVADINGDGHPDLVVANYGYTGTGTGSVSVLLGNGNGTFKNQTPFTTGDYPFALTLADVNGDGQPDLVTANKYSASVSVLLGNANGTFQNPVDYGVDAKPVAVTVADVNGDGNPDLVVANFGSANVSVLLGNGNGTFSSQNTFGTNVGPYGVAVADLNGDGFPDLVVANYNVTNPGHVSVLMGNGNGTFQAQQQLTSGTGPVSVAVGDLNNDSRPDIVASNFSGDSVSVWLNAGNGDFTGQVYTITPVAPTHFVITGTPATLTAGSSFNFTVTDEDQANATVTNYTGTVHFTSSDSQAVLPADAKLSHGIGVFSATLMTTGNQTITATDTVSSSISGTNAPIAVSLVAINHFAISVPTVATAGTSFKFTVTAQDLLFHTDTSYAGTIHFSSTDSSAVLPPDSTLANGIGTFSTTLNTPGSQTILVDDTVTNTLTGMTGPIAVSAAATHFMVSAPSSVTAGNELIFVVTALDQSNNVAAGYNGIVHITSTDGQASLSANGTLTGGVGYFAALLRTAGNQTLTATDSVTSSIAGVSGTITVSPTAANHFAVSVPSTAVTGIPFTVTVTAVDPFNNPVAAYAGTVHFTTSDPHAVLPANTTLSGGSGTFSVTFKTPGTQSITAADTTAATMVGTSSPTSVAGLAVSGLTINGSAFTLTFNEPFVAADINLYDLPVTGGLLGPTDVTLTSANASPANGPVSYHGTLILNDPVHPTAFTFVKTSSFTGQTFNPDSGMLTPGTYTLTLRSASNGFHDSLGNLLSDANGIAGNNFVTTFVVNASSAAVVGIPGFARGPGNAVILPNTAAGAANQGIPINLGNITSAQSVTSGSFTLVYNPQLLTITGATGFAGNGVTLNAVVNTPGTATITFTSTAALPSASASAGVRLGVLTATVPIGAASFYGDKVNLNFTSESLNGGAIPVSGDDAAEVVAYFGDASGDGQISGGDAALIGELGTASAQGGTLPGFPAYRLADPLLIADLANTGVVSSSDVTLINLLVAGSPRTQIPPVNPGNLTITHFGPDPVLSLPTDLAFSPGNTVVVPVNIDTARPTGSAGMTEAILALQFDPNVFSVSAADVQLGSLPDAGSGWQLQTVVNTQTGKIGIDLFSSTPIQTTAGGSLVTITVGVRGQGPGVSEAGSEVSLTSDRSGLPALFLVNEVNPTGQRSFQTAVADALGAFVVQMAIADGGQWTVDGNRTLASSPSSAMVFSPTNSHQTPTTASVVEQVFGNLVQENSLGQPGAILNTELYGPEGTSVSDQALLQQVGAAQRDWVPDDMVAYLGQAATAGRRGPIADLLAGAGADEDGADLTGVEELLAGGYTAGRGAREY